MTAETKLEELAVQARRHMARAVIEWAEGPGRWPETRRERLAVEAAVEAAVWPAVQEAVEDGATATGSGLPEFAAPIAVTIWRDAGRRAAASVLGER